MAKSAKRRWRRVVFYGLGIILLVLVSAEVSVRIIGFEPWIKPTVSFEVTPGGTLFAADSTLGYKGKPGHFTCIIDHQCRFQVTHAQNGFRITRPPNGLENDSLPEIWIFGCSFTHGYGVNDHETWPWLVQKALPNYRVRNFGMTAYGTYQASLLLDSLLKTNPSNLKTVVLAYGGFHNQRNTASRFWRKALDGQQAATDLTYPYLAYTDEQVLTRRRERLKYQPVPGQSWSAFAHFIDNYLALRSEHSLQSDRITQDLIQHMHARTRSTGADFMLAQVQNDIYTTGFTRELEDITVTDISVNLEDSTLRILPADGHPNAKGHALMAQRFINTFRSLYAVEGK